MLAKRAERAGRAWARRGSKARRPTAGGRANAALPKVRARPLEGQTGQQATRDGEQGGGGRHWRGDAPLEHGWECQRARGDGEGRWRGWRRKRAREESEAAEVAASVGAPKPFRGGFADGPVICRPPADALNASTPDGPGEGCRKAASSRTCRTMRQAVASVVALSSVRGGRAVGGRGRKPSGGGAGRMDGSTEQRSVPSRPPVSFAGSTQTSRQADKQTTPSSASAG